MPASHLLHIRRAIDAVACRGPRSNRQSAGTQHGERTARHGPDRRRQGAGPGLTACSPANTALRIFSTLSRPGAVGAHAHQTHSRPGGGPPGIRAGLDADRRARGRKTTTAGILAARSTTKAIRSTSRPSSCPTPGVHCRSHHGRPACRRHRDGCGLAHRGRRQHVATCSNRCAIFAGPPRATRSTSSTRLHMLSGGAFQRHAQDAGKPPPHVKFNLRHHRDPKSPDHHPVAVPALRLRRIEPAMITSEPVAHRRAGRGEARERGTRHGGAGVRRLDARCAVDIRPGDRPLLGQGHRAGVRDMLGLADPLPRVIDLFETPDEGAMWRQHSASLRRRNTMPRCRSRDLSLRPGRVVIISSPACASGRRWPTTPRFEQEGGGVGGTRARPSISRRRCRAGSSRAPGRCC